MPYIGVNETFTGNFANISSGKILENNFYNRYGDS